jgi:hypothetical protein
VSLIRLCPDAPTDDVINIGLDGDFTRARCGTSDECKQKAPCVEIWHKGLRSLASDAQEDIDGRTLGPKAQTVGEVPAESPEPAGAGGAHTSSLVCFLSQITRARISG